MKISWPWLIAACLPILVQLWWLPQWSFENGRAIPNMSYYVLGMISAAVAVRKGLRFPSPVRGKDIVLRVVVFVCCFSLNALVGNLSGCSFIQRVPKTRMTLR